MTNRIATVATLITSFLIPAVALAEPTAGTSASDAHMGTFAIAMCLGVGLAAFGGGMGQGRAAGSALEGICRNPNAADKVFTPFILGLAFIESLVIFTFVTAFLVYGWKV